MKYNPSRIAKNQIVILILPTIIKIPMMHRFIILTLFTFFSSISFGQLEVNFATNDDPAPGGTMDIDVSVNNFDEIVTFQYFILWDSLVLTYNSILNVTNDLPDFVASNVGTPDDTVAGEDGVLTVSWNQLNTLPASVADGTTLFTVRMNVVGNACDSTALSIGNIPPFQNIEVIDENFNDIGAVATPLPVAIPGTDCGDGGGGGPTVTINAPNLSGDPGDNICVPITVNGFADIQSAQAGLMWDPTVLEFFGLQNFGISGLAPGSFNLDNVEDGMTGFTWIDNSGTNPETLPNGGTLFEICFEVTGAAGSSSTLKFIDNPDIEFSDSAGNVLNASSSTGTISVNDDGGGGGDGDIGLIAADVTVMPGSNICVPVSVQGFNDVQSAQAGIMFDPSLLSFTSTRNYGLPGMSAGSFNAMNASAGRIGFIWFDGTGVTPQTLADDTVIFEICFDAVGAAGSSAVVSFIDSPDIEFSDSNSDLILPFFTQPGTVTISGQPPTGVFSLNGQGITIQDNQQTACIDITTENFTNIAAIQFSMTWPNGLTNPVISNTNTSVGLAPGLFNQTGANELGLSWASPTGTGQNLADGTPFFTICFDVTNCTPGNFQFVNGSQVQIEIGDGDANPVQFSFDPISIGCGTINPPGNIVIGTANIDPVDCFGGTDGSISINPTGGTGTLTCVWRRGNVNGPIIPTTGHNLMNQPAGIYTVVVSDSNESITGEYTITQRDPMIISGQVFPETCGGLGGITVTVTQSSGDFSCAWSTGASGCAIGGLASGTYAITVTDNIFGCQQVESYAIGLDNNLVVTPTPIPGDCNGGSISLAVSPPGNYDYMWSIPGASNGPTQTGLTPGVYSYTVTSVGGNCSSSGSVEVTSNVAAVELGELTTVDATCNGNDGSAAFVVLGGCPPFDCMITSPDGTLSSCDDLTGLVPGSYTVVINDNFLTPAFVGSFEINGATPIVIIPTITQPMGGVAGSIDLDVTGGVPPYTYTWSTGDITTVPSLGGLADGQYSVTVTDASSCTEELSGIEITGDCTNPIISDAFASALSCGSDCNGEWMANISGCAPYQVVFTDGEGNSFDFEVLTSNALITGLCPGDYAIIVTDAVGNSSNAITSISAPETLVVSLDNTVCDDGGDSGSITITTSGGSGGLTYNWLPFGGNGSTAENLSAGTYEVQVTDVNGCLVSQVYTVTECTDPPPPGLACGESNTLLTPNGDLQNNALYIECALENNNTLAVYDRWGRLIHEGVNYSNDWAGTNMDGDILTEGTYFWVLDVIFPSGESRIYKGYINVVREN